MSSNCDIGIHNTIKLILNDKPWFKYELGDVFIEIIDSPNGKINKDTSYGVSQTVSNSINKQINNGYKSIGNIAYPVFDETGRGMVQIEITNQQKNLINSINEDEIAELEEEIKQEKIILENEENKISVITQELDDASRAEMQNVPSYLFQSKKDFNDLVDDDITSQFDATIVPKDEDSTIKNDTIKNEIASILFNGELTTKNILNNIKNSGVIKNKQIISILNKLVLSTKANVKVIDKEQLLDKDTYMQFNTATNTIEIAIEVLGDVSSVKQGLMNFIHEVLHERTLRIIKAPKNAEEKQLVQDYTDLYNNIKTEFEGKYTHELSSLEEFVAGLLSNKKFRTDVNKFTNLEKSFWQKLINYLKQFLNLDSSYTELLNDIVKLIDFSSDIFTGEETLQSKYTINRPNVELNKLEKTSSQIENTIEVLLNKVRSYKDDSTIKKNVIKLKDELDALTKNLDKASDDYHYIMLQKFTMFMGYQLSDISSFIELNKDVNVFTSTKFTNADSFLNSFLDVHNDIIDSFELLKNKNIITEEDYDNLVIELQTHQKNALEYKKILVRIAKNYIKSSDVINSKFYRQVELRKKLEYELDGKKLGLKGSDLTNYVTQELIKNASEIRQLTKQEFNALFDQPFVDISSLSSNFNNEKDFNHPIINLFSSILDSVKTTFTNIIQPRLIDLQTEFNKFSEGNTLKSSDKLNKNIVAKDGNGQYHLRGAYKIDLKIKLDELSSNIKKAAEEFGENSNEFKIELAAKDKFILNNTTKVIIGQDENGENINQYQYIDKWKDDLSDLTEKEKDYLNYLIKLAEDSHSNYDSNIKSLKKTYNNATFYKLPSIVKSTLTNIKGANLIESTKEWYNETFTRRIDETDEGQMDDRTFNNPRIYTDLSGREIKYLPIHFRGTLKESQQSLDLATIYALEYSQSVKYKTKKEVSDNLEMFKAVVAEGKVIKTVGGIDNFISSVWSKDNTPVEYDAVNSNLVKMLDTMLNIHLYDITKVYAGKIGKWDVNKLEALSRRTMSNVTLPFNFISDSVNLLTGKINSLLESIGDPNIELQNAVNAHKVFGNNVMGLMSDTGRNVKTSFINQLGNQFNIYLKSSMLESEFEYNKTLNALKDSPYALRHLGEHNVAVIHMMSILDSIKILNKKGEYLDKDGKVTKDINNALSLLFAYELDSNNKLILNKKLPNDFYTTYNAITSYKNGTESMIRGYIQTSLQRSQGNYSPEYLADVQRYFYGKALFHFKKHIISPALRRFRGIGNAWKNDEDVILNINSDMGRPDEGNYITFVRFIRNVVMPALKEHKFNILKAYDVIKNESTNRNEWELANIKRTSYELSIIVALSIATSLLVAAADDDDDRLLWTLALIMRRTEGELFQFLNPTEAARLMKNPIAAMNIVNHTISLFEGVVSHADLNEEDRDEATKKVLRSTRKLLPVSAFTDPKKTLNYINNN